MYAFNMLSHLRLLTQGAGAVGLQSKLHWDTLRMEVSGGGRYFDLEPEFIAPSGRGVTYSSTLRADTQSFAGWRTAPRKRCELADNKQAFKDFCVRNGLRTPRTFERPAAANTTLLVKELRRASNPGRVLGPLAPQAVPADSPSQATRLLEEYVAGDPIEAWYWDGELTTVERRKKPQVLGDGVSSVRELMECACVIIGEADWDAAENLLRLQGLSLDAVAPAGREVTVGIKFWSAFQQLTTGDHNVLPGIVGSPLHQQLLHAGPVFWRGIPQDTRPHTVFNVSAVVDAQSRAWFVDMNTDVYVDPHAYPAMLRGLFGISPVPLIDPAALAALPAASTRPS